MTVSSRVSITARTSRLDKAAAAWLRAIKRTSPESLLVAGCGWWRIRGWHRPVQGLHNPGQQLVQRGRIRRTHTRAWVLVD